VEYWIVEHPTRGVFCGWHDRTWHPSGDSTRKPNFRWSIPRSAGKHLWTMAEAQSLCDELNAEMKGRCYLLHARPTRHGHFFEELK